MVPANEGLNPEGKVIATDASSELAVENKTEVPLPLSDGTPVVILVKVPVFVDEDAVL